MRLKIVFYLSLVVLVAAFATAQVSKVPSGLPCGPPPNPSPAPLVSWPQFQFDAAHTGCNPYEYLLGRSTVANLTLKWTQFVTYAANSLPVVVGGVAYLSFSRPAHYDTAGVVAVRTSDGSVLWTYTIGPPANYPYSSPVVANGVVYIASDELYALDASTGALIWKYPVSSTLPPAVGNGTIYVPYALSDSGAIDALNASTGAFIWNYTFAAPYYPTEPAVANGVIYTSSNFIGAYVNALDATTGVLLWKYDGGEHTLSSPVVANGVVYVSSSYEGTDEFEGLSAFSLPGH